MKHTRKKLKEYGLTFNLNDELLGNYESRLYNRNKKHSCFPIDLTSGLDLIVVDVTLFKQKFRIPEKYNALTDNSFKEICVESFKEGEMSFYNPEYGTDLYFHTPDLVKKNRELYFKTNKKYKLKYTFNKEEADKWLSTQLQKLVEGLLLDPDIFLARQALYGELVASIMKDREKFIASLEETAF